MEKIIHIYYNTKRNKYILKYNNMLKICENIDYVLDVLKQIKKSENTTNIKILSKL
jgi:hypothetical protein